MGNSFTHLFNLRNRFLVFTIDKFYASRRFKLERQEILSKLIYQKTHLTLNRIVRLLFVDYLCVKRYNSC